MELLYSTPSQSRAREIVEWEKLFHAIKTIYVHTYSERDNCYYKLGIAFFHLIDMYCGFLPLALFFSGCGFNECWSAVAAPLFFRKCKFFSCVECFSGLEGMDTSIQFNSMAINFNNFCQVCHFSFISMETLAMFYSFYRCFSILYGTHGDKK